MNVFVQGGLLLGVLICRHSGKEEKCFLWSNELEKISVRMLNDFYARNASLCTRSIIREIRSYGNVSWLHLAVIAQAKIFISQRAIQDVLNNIWSEKERPFLPLQ